MKSRLSLALLLVVIAVLLASPALAGPTPAPPGPTAPEAGTPINAACYVAAPGQCKLHLDPFNVVVNPQADTFLKTVRLTASVLPAGAAQTIYEYGTGIHNLPPPASGYYMPSSPAEDFPALCSATYQLNIWVLDSQSDVFANAGQTRPITCPASNVNTTFLPGTFGQVGAAGLPLLGVLIGGAWAWRRRREA